MADNGEEGRAGWAATAWAPRCPRLGPQAATAAQPGGGVATLAAWAAVLPADLGPEALGNGRGVRGVAAARRLGGVIAVVRTLGA